MVDTDRKMNDGGPAFPIYTQDMNVGSDAGPGMSLRDWFASHALMNCSGIATEIELKRLFPGGRTRLTRAEITAAQAYEIADAMLRARKESSNG